MDRPSARTSVVEGVHASRPFVLGIAPRVAFVGGDETLVDPQRLGLYVDVVPTQREHLAASQAEQRTEPERHRPSVLDRRLKEAVDLAAGVTEPEILDDYPTLTVARVRVAAAHGTDLARDGYPSVASG